MKKLYQYLNWWHSLNDSEKDIFTRIVISEKASFKRLNNNQINKIFKYNKTSRK